MRSRADILLTLISVVVITHYSYTYNSFSVNAQLPSFPRQEINDGISDGLLLLDSSTSSNRSSNYKSNINNSHDIQAISHSSDGKTLNTTLWLSGNVKKDPTNTGAISVSYGVLVDVDNNPSTGNTGIDFQKEIKWTANSGNWTSSLIEFSSSGNKKIKILESNFSITKEQPFFPITIDLNSITSPAIFRVAYYSICYYNDSRSNVDITNWIDVPPAKYSISTLPKDLVLNQGNNLDVGVQLVSNTGISPKVLNFIPNDNHSRVSIQFNPDGIDTSSFSLAPAPFRVTAHEDAPVGQYTIPISANVSLETGKNGKIEIPSTNVSLAGNGYIIIKPNMTISVIEKPPFGQEFKDFWTTYGQVISLFGAGFAGGFSTHIMDRIKQRGKKEKI